MFLYLLHSFKLYCEKYFQGCSTGILNLTLWPIKTYTEDKLIQKWINDDILVAMWIQQYMGRFGVNGIWILIDLYTCCINFKQSPTKLQTSAFQLVFKIWASKQCFHLSRYRFHNYRDFSATCVYVVSTSCSSVQRAPLVLHHLVVNMSWWMCMSIHFHQKPPPDQI